MCEPTTMMLGTTAMGAMQMASGASAGQAQADMAAASAQAGYQGAMQQYDAEIEYLNRVEAHKWDEYRRAQEWRTTMVNAQFESFENTIDAVNQDAASRATALIAGTKQLWDSTKVQVQEGWSNVRKAQSTKKAMAMSRGVEGRSVDAEINEAERAMAMQEMYAIEAIAWDSEQKLREARMVDARAEGAINAAMPSPIQHVNLPGPGQMRPQMPNQHTFQMQAHAGYVQGHQQAQDAMFSGASTMMSGFGNYYSQTNPPTGTT